MTFAPLIQTTIEHILPSWKIYDDIESVIKAPQFGGKWVKYVVTKQNNGCVALTFALKSILKQKKNYGNSNISPCKNIIFKKSSTRNQNPLRYYNSMINLKFQHKPKYHLSKILI
jgi:hypothetical protein